MKLTLQRKVYSTILTIKLCLTYSRKRTMKLAQWRLEIDVIDNVWDVIYC